MTRALYNSEVARAPQASEHVSFFNCILVICYFVADKWARNTGFRALVDENLYFFAKKLETRNLFVVGNWFFWWL